MHHIEDVQPCSTASSFVAKKPETLHFTSQLWKGRAGFAREPRCGQREAEVRCRSEVLRAVAEASSMGTT